jgi:hypothetical protein
MNYSKITLTSLTILSFYACAPKQSSSPYYPPPVVEEQAFEVRSTPAGARVQLSTGQSCTTPCTLKISNDEKFSLTISREGYKSATVQVSNNLQALREFNRRKGVKEEDLRALRVKDLRLTPNPVQVTLEPTVLF